MTWRPKNWEIPDGQWDFVDWSNAQIYECGADEMFNAVMEHLKEGKLAYLDYIHRHGSLEKLIKELFKEE